MDFAEPFRLFRAGLVSGRGHYERVIQAVLEAKRSVWVATANLKELMVEDPRLVPGRARTRRRYRSILEAFDELASKGVELRILHAAPPSGPFREQFDTLPRLVRGGIALRTCPRVHLKIVVVDASLVYLGSANWTGAGLGAKGGATSSSASSRTTTRRSTPCRRSTKGSGGATSANDAGYGMNARCRSTS